MHVRLGRAGDRLTVTGDQVAELRKWPINHRKREDSPLGKRALNYFERTEAGFDGLARANLRFSEQGGP